jgi:hypothetical protein
MDAVACNTAGSVVVSAIEFPSSVVPVEGAVKANDELLWLGGSRGLLTTIQKDKKQEEQKNEGIFCSRAYIMLAHRHQLVCLVVNRICQHRMFL